MKLAADPVCSSSIEREVTKKTTYRYLVGLRDQVYYGRCLSPWRNSARQTLLPYLSAETSLILTIQKFTRTLPYLSAFFTASAYLGTHTCFFLAIPICVWCISPREAMVITRLLACGVIISGFLKDLLCLPRPASPPVRRLGVTANVLAEYGFPSTHATNAVSLAIYAFWLLNSSFSPHPHWRIIGSIIVGIYAISVTLGRISCGVHGLVDVTAGTCLGALLTLIQIFAGPHLDSWLTAASPVNVTLSIGIIALILKFYPAPAEACPCYQDSLAFAAVLAGLHVSAWEIQNTLHAASLRSRANILSIHDNTSFIYLLCMALLRVSFGLALIFIWRSISRIALHTIITHAHRIYLPYMTKFYTLLDTFSSLIPRARLIKTCRVPWIQVSIHKITFSWHSRSTSITRRSLVTNRRVGYTPVSYPAKSFAHVNFDTLSRFIVYFGIAWLTFVGMPLLFQLTGV